MTAGERPGRLCAVYWRDIVSHAGWSDEWEPELEPIDCVDVGWVRDYPDHIVLTRSCDLDTPAAGDIAAIPRGCIRAILPLAEPAQPDEP